MTEQPKILDSGEFRAALPTGSGSFDALRSWSLPPRIVRVMGDPRLRLEGTLLALQADFDGTAWSLEEPGVLRHWTLENGREHSRLALSDLESLWCIAPKGDYIASGGEDWSLWSRRTGTVLLTGKPASWVTALAFHPGGQLLATGHEDGGVRLWNLVDGQLRREWPTHPTAISALAFSTHGETLAAASEFCDLHLWNVAHGMKLGVLPGHPDRVTSLVWHPDHRHLVSAGWDTTARLWDTETSECLYLLNGQADQVVALAYAPNGRYLATADSDHLVWLWDPFRGKVLRRFKGHKGDVTCLSFTPDSRRVVSGGADGRIVLWDVITGKNVFRASDSVMAQMRLSISPGGSQAACVMGGHSLHLWNLQKEPPRLEALPVTSEATAVAHSRDGKWLATGHASGFVQLWNRRTNRPLAPLHEHKTRVTALAFSPTRPVLASAGGVDGYVYLWSLKNGAPLLLVPEAARHCSVEAIAFVPNSPWFLAGGVDWPGQGPSEGAIQLWDLTRPGPVVSCDHAVTALRVHPTGEFFAAALLEESIGLFETRTLKLIRELPSHQAPFAALAFSPNGEWLASAGEDAQLRLWAMPEGKLLHTLDLDAPVRDLAFTPDGTAVATANANATLYFVAVAQRAGNLAKLGQPVAS